MKHLIYNVNQGMFFSSMKTEKRTKGRIAQIILHFYIFYWIVFINCFSLNFEFSCAHARFRDTNYKQN